MPVETQINSTGVKQALRVLNSTDRRLRRQITIQYKEITMPLVTKAKNMVPDKAPLSGMERSWTPIGATSSVLPYSPTGRTPKIPRNWQQSALGRRQMGEWLKWNAGIRAYISGKRPISRGGYTRNLAAFGVRWQGAASVLFDTSGQAQTPQGQRMIAALNAKYGPPSRVMWRAYEQTDARMQYELKQLVNKVMMYASRKMV